MDAMRSLLNHASATMLSKAAGEMLDDRDEEEIERLGSAKLASTFASLPDVRAGTVDAFQGQDRGVVILSLVDPPAPPSADSSAAQP